MASCAQRWTIAVPSFASAPSPPRHAMAQFNLEFSNYICISKNFYWGNSAASALRVVRWSAAVAAAFGYHNFYDGKTIRASRSPVAVAVAEWSISWRIALWNPFRRQTVVDCHNKERETHWLTAGDGKYLCCLAACGPREVDLSGQTRPLFLNPFTGSEQRSIAARKLHFLWLS